MTVRDLIINALVEAKLLNRNQNCPASLFEDARTLLINRVAEYSATNYLEFARESVEFNTEGKQNFTIGEPIESGSSDVIISSDDLVPSEEYLGKIWFNPLRDDVKEVDGNKVIQPTYVCTQVGPDSFSWVRTSRPTLISEIYSQYPDVLANGLSEITRVYYRTSKNNDNWIELRFVSYEDFPLFNEGTNVYTYKRNSDTLAELSIKRKQNLELKVIYNKAFNVDDVNIELNIPSHYISLITCALVLDLAIAYPRLSDNTITLIRSKLNSLESTTRRVSSVNKFISRKPYWYGMNNWEIGESGNFLL